MSGSGVFVAVVGPSGAGKDTLMRAAAARRPDLVLARRVISRPPSDETEDFQSVSAKDFERLEAQGAFALSWRAHGLGYGIPREVDADLAAGRTVLANLSRGVLEEARARFQRVRVVVVEAPKDVLFQRLEVRGREDAGDIRRRLDRAAPAAPAGPDVTVVENSGALALAVTAFLAALPQPPSG